MEASEKKPGNKTYILLGPPGSGKSTQAEYFKERYQAVHLDMGNALRRAAAEPTPIGQELYEIINKKKELVPDGVMRAVLEREVRNVPKDALLIIDGTPRRRSQIDSVVGSLAAYGRSIDKVVFIELSERDSVERISNRFSCADCGTKFILGKDFRRGDTCSRCGGVVVQRTDDTPDGVRTRWRIFHEDTIPVLEFFAEQGKLIRVSGTESSEMIFDAIMEGV